MNNLGPLEWILVAVEVDCNVEVVSLDVFTVDYELMFLVEL